MQELMFSRPVGFHHPEQSHRIEIFVLSPAGVELAFGATVRVEYSVIFTPERPRVGQLFGNEPEEKEPGRGPE